MPMASFMLKYKIQIHVDFFLNPVTKKVIICLNYEYQLQIELNFVLSYL